MELLTVSNIAVSRFILGRIKYATLQMQHLTSSEIKTKIKICPPYIYDHSNYDECNNSNGTTFKYQ